MEQVNKKAALLSFHNAYNYGAAMQAYGLQEALKTMGVEPEYIDYVNDHRRYTYDTAHQIKEAIRSRNYIRAIRLIAGSGFIFVRGKKFKAFNRKYLSITEKTYRNSDEAAVLNEEYDKFIVGSDQVWNCKNNGGDTAYLLDFVINPKKKFSYASSFGMDDIPENFIKRYSDALLNLGRIGVREVAGSHIVEKYTGRKPHVVLDPVFIATKQTWNNLKQAGTVKQEDYIFFYTNKNTQIRDFWNIGYERENVKSHILSSFVGIKDFLNLDTSVKVAMSPPDFLNEIASAKLVVTASFHCVAFSIIFHKQFVVFLSGNRGKDERILNLLHICGLESRIINSQTSVDDINEVIDYNEVDKKLKPYIEYSYEYLKNAVYSLPDVHDLQFPTGNSKYFCNDERCSGCMACFTVCPTSAISFIRNTEGFMIPERDTKKCIDCYLCHNACQVYSPVKSEIETQGYYAVKNTDDIRLKSSSGGVFTAISDAVLKNKGVICAASIDENFNVKHSFAYTPDERDKMRGTFYVQSDVSNVHKEIKSLLKMGKEVLFVGTPCQVAGLYKSLASCDISQLYTCDLVCHGVPSPGVFESFIDYLRKNNTTLDSFMFRDKDLGWKHGYTVSATRNNKKEYNTLELQSFSKMFSHNVINRQSCANCMYTNYDRIGDITIGDFWGIEKRNHDVADSLGVSLAIVNTQKGRKLFSSCAGMTTVEVNKEDTKQNSLIKQAYPSENRMDAFRIFAEKGYGYLARKYGEYNFTGKMKQIIRTLLNK